VLPMHYGHSVLLLEDGQAFFPALIAAIDASTSEVRLETYIFQFQDAGERVAMALEAAAQRGVRVYLMMDGIGTPTLPAQWAQRLTEAGVLWHRFSPLGALGLLLPGSWRRLHRKLCVVDAHIAFCGGINILDDLQDHVMGRQTLPRFDFAVQVQGPLVADVRATMVQFWARLQATRQLERMQWRGAQQTLRVSHDAPPAEATDTAAATPGIHASLLLRDNVRNRNTIERAYRRAIAGAREEVLIANAYCIPGGKLRRALVHAARRGVRVRLLLQGQYESFMQFHAARPVLGALLAAGVEIHEYRDRALHAKVAVVDGHWATVGSSNLDPLSLLLAREANVVLEDRVFAGLLRTRLNAAIADHGIALDAASYAARPLRQRFLDRLAFGIMRALLFLTGRRY
jgi:cardiolipin synthase